MFTPWMDLERTLSGLGELRRRMDRVLDDRSAGAVLSSAAFEATPRVTFRDAGSSVVLALEVPGFAQDDVKVTVSRELLSISGERKNEAPEGYTAHRQERGTLRFSRSFALPIPVDSDEATATVKAGILTVTLPKLPELQPRSIAIQTATN